MNGPQNGHPRDLAHSPAAQTQMLPPWMLQIRQAMASAIKPEDLTAIFAAQVELAKKGDQKAIKFVFEQARALSEIKGSTFVQNNFAAGVEPPEKPTPARSGTSEKVERMRMRQAVGAPVTNDADGPEVDLR